MRNDLNNILSDLKGLYRGLSLVQSAQIWQTVLSDYLESWRLFMNYKCKDCQYITVFMKTVRKKKKNRTKRVRAHACDINTQWVKTIKANDPACKYFKPK